MDFWNRKKVKELEAKHELFRKQAEAERTDLKKEIERLKIRLDEAYKIIRGDRVCGGYCDKCGHSIVVDKPMIFGSGRAWVCELDCKCKDFQRKDAES